MLPNVSSYFLQTVHVVRTTLPMLSGLSVRRCSRASHTDWPGHTRIRLLARRYGRECWTPWLHCPGSEVPELGEEQEPSGPGGVVAHQECRPSSRKEKKNQISSPPRTGRVNGNIAYESRFFFRRRDSRPRPGWILREIRRMAILATTN